MRKNKMMRLASSLLVAVLITTSTISGTFAKYTTQDSASDTARVAKWGITVQASGNLFGKFYKATTDDSIVAESTNVASNGAIDGFINVVAPGTKNEKGFTIAVNGQPEVQYEITATVDSNANVDGDQDVEEIYLKAGKYGVMVKVTGLNNATDMTKYYVRNDGTGEYTVAPSFVDGTTYYELHDEVTLTSDYYPITWTVTHTGMTDIALLRLEDIANKMAENLSAKDGNANVATNFNYNLKWKWDIENGADAAAKKISNGADTILGNLMAGLNPANEEVVRIDSSIVAPTKDTHYNLEVAFGMKVTVEQVN